MLLRVNGPKDLLAGLIFIVFGLATFWKSHDYEVGSALEMGPGYFPAAMGVVLTILGIAAIARGLTLKVADPITPHKLEPLLLIFGGIIAFSLLIETTGLLIAAAVLIALACYRRLRSNPLEVLAIYVGLTGFSAFLFVYLFEMQLPLFWWR